MILPSDCENREAALVEAIQSAWVTLAAKGAICSTLEELRAEVFDVQANLAHAVRDYPHPEIDAWATGKPWPPEETE